MKRRFAVWALLGVLLFGVAFLGFIGYRERSRLEQQRRIVARIQAAGGQAYFDYQYTGKSINRSKPPVTHWIIRALLGDDAFAKVETVLLSDSQKTTDAEIALLPELPDLKDIAMAGAAVTDRSMMSIAKLSKLRGVSLTDTKVTADGLAQLCGCSDFVSLTLWGPTITDDFLLGLQSLPTLQYLQLVRTKVTSAGLAHLSNMTQLREIDIFEAPAVGDDGLEHLARLSNLRLLWVMGTNISKDGAVRLKQSLPGCRIQSQGQQENQMSLLY